MPHMCTNAYSYYWRCTCLLLSSTFRLLLRFCIDLFVCPLCFLCPRFLLFHPVLLRELHLQLSFTLNVSPVNISLLLHVHISALSCSPLCVCTVALRAVAPFEFMHAILPSDPRLPSRFSLGSSCAE